MPQLSIVDQILQESELRNERTVAWARLLLSGGLLAVGWIHFLSLIPDGWTATVVEVGLCSSYFLIALVLGIILQGRTYRFHLKFLIITLDYAFFGFLLFDFFGRGALTEELAVGACLIVILFFLINILRYSWAASLYAGLLTIGYFAALAMLSHLYQAFFFVHLTSVVLFILLIGFFASFSGRKHLIHADARKKMSRYLAPEILEEWGAYRVDPILAGRKQEVTILVSRIRHLATLMESHTPSNAVERLNTYLSSMSDIVFQQRGTVGILDGEEIRALYGTPMPQRNEALNAVVSGLQMLRRTKDFFSEETALPIQIGIGINTGEAILGHIGSLVRTDYSAWGESVDLAGQLANLTKEYKRPLLFSRSTYEKLLDEELGFLIREVDTVMATSQTPIRIYEPIVYDDEGARVRKSRAISVFQMGLELYRKGRFDQALKVFQSLQGDPVSDIFQGRCRTLVMVPPKEWTGAWDFRNL